MLAPACTAEPPEEQSVAPPIAAPPVEASVLRVIIHPPAVQREARGRAELAGLFTALVESGLADLADVVPVVRGATISPGLSGALELGASTWTSRLSMTPSADQGHELALELCDAADVCLRHTSTAPRDRTAASVAELLGDAAAQLGRKPFTGTSTAWALPESKDAYATLLTGRAAAIFYGLLPPLAPEAIGDRRKDPFDRSILIDPNMPIAQWLAGRRALLLDRPKTAFLAFERAASKRPAKQLYRADAAMALLVGREGDPALDAWEQVIKRSPSDLRFAVPHAEALVRIGDLARAERELAALPDRYERDPHVVELRVAIDDALGGTNDRDALLVLWQEVAPGDPEPVRRRIAGLVAARDFTGALALVPALSARGAQSEAARLGAALAIAVRDYETAAQDLVKLGMDEALRRLRARQALERDPAALLPELATSTDPIAIVARGGALLTRGRFDDALAESDRALRIEPWMPEALALRYEALVKLGRNTDATMTLSVLRAADPAWGFEVPVRPARTSSLTPIVSATTATEAPVTTTTRAR
ncbi:tetratricopeptide repeat protein [Myxococcota bacterium]|nr:tetratricopeptide repeat protein [Myxococcota bacterium]